MSDASTKSRRRWSRSWVAGALVATGAFALAASSSVRQSSAPPAAAPAAVASEARALFVKNCAACHGESGDGKGTTVLERPARSFMDGGFSYGNTPEAVLRTITFGIPGSLMPSFGDALKEDERKSLASYVIALGPPGLDVTPKDTVMVVRDRALVVRGKLPPIGDSAKETVRGLLIGLPAGLTFAYDMRNMRLLGVFSGEFVDRRDWIGRGGDALQPLGQLVRAASASAGVLRRTEGHVVSSTQASIASSATADHRGEQVERVSTHVTGNLVRLSYDCRDASGAVEVHVEESPEPFVCSLGSGWKLTRLVRRRHPGTPLRFELENPEVRPWHTIDDGLRYMLMPERTTGATDVRVLLHTRHVNSVPGWIEVQPEADVAQWTVFDFPGVVLPKDDAARHLAIVRAAMELR